MKVEVDQSGKIGDTKVPTALAFSNHKQYSILIPATVKRKCIQRLRGKGKLETRVYIQLFAVGLFLLLRKNIQSAEQVVIDVEYPGHEAKIKEHLINLLHREGIGIHRTKIQFGFVGKKSRAHHVAIETFKGKLKPDQIIQLEQVLREFRK